MPENTVSKNTEKNLKLLIAYDGSSDADAAIDDLRRAGLPQVAEVVVLTVADILMPHYKTPDPSLPAHVIAEIMKARAPFLQAVESARATATRAAERLHTAFPDWAVQVEASAASPASAIIKKAQAWKPDMIVVGTQGHSALGGRLLGSVSQKVITEARCSVRIGRRSATAPVAEAPLAEAPPRLVVGWDGSLDAQAAVSVLTSREWPAGSAVHVVTVCDSHCSVEIARQFPELAQWIEEEAAGDEFAWLHKMAESAAQRLRAAGLEASVVAKHGNPKRVLLEEAQ
ncbi:MAG TPA: universal stress protein, partial [Abditibacteriaceae bacterium]|nr:universal stress protein [Abditibacteriaceae bacterium]